MSSSQKEEVWLRFAAAALSNVSIHGTTHACKAADAMTLEWDSRFGDAAQLLAG